MAQKFRQKGLTNRFRNSIKFNSRTSRYDDNNTQNINILSRHHKKILGWGGEFKNKYACDRWIHDTRGCGYGCIVSKKRFLY